MNQPTPTPALAATPRTDAEKCKMNICMTSVELEAVPADFARTLERELTETERLRFGADADRRQLRCELAAAKAECERLTANQREPAEDIFVSHLCDELARLRALSDQLSNNLSAVGAACNVEKDRAEKAEAALAEAKVERETIAQSSLRSLEAYIDKLKQFAERAERAEADNAKWQRLLLMSRDDREIDLISEIEEQARLLGMSGEREADLLGKLGRLESELAAIKNGHGELGKYEQLRLKNAELQAELAAMKGTP
jgi:hypothetical protein